MAVTQLPVRSVGSHRRSWYDASIANLSDEGHPGARGEIRPMVEPVVFAGVGREAGTERGTALLSLRVEDAIPYRTPVGLLFS